MPLCQPLRRAKLCIGRILAKVVAAVEQLIVRIRGEPRHGIVGGKELVVAVAEQGGIEQGAAIGIPPHGVVPDKIGAHVVIGIVGAVEAPVVVHLYRHVPQQVIGVLQAERAGQTGLVAGALAGFFAGDLRHTASYPVPEVVVYRDTVLGVFGRRIVDQHPPQVVVVAQGFRQHTVGQGDAGTAGKLHALVNGVGQGAVVYHNVACPVYPQGIVEDPALPGARLHPPRARVEVADDDVARLPGRLVEVV